MEIFNNQTRRTALKKIGLLAAGTASLPTLGTLLQACKSTPNQEVIVTESNFLVFDNEQMDMVTNLSDIIIPATGSPGAKEAKCAESIDVILGECFEQKEVDLYLQGLKDFKNKFQKDTQNTWEEASPESQIDFLEKIDETTYTEKTKREDLESPLFFWMLTKDLTVLSYFTSEPGATKALEYVPFSQKYEPCLEVTEDTRIWIS